MSYLIISSASRSSPRIFIYHSSHIILIPSSFHSVILAFFTFPLIHFIMVLFAVSSKLIFNHFIYHTLLFIIPSSFPSYFNSITFITIHPCFSFSFASMISIHSFLSIPIPFFLSTTSMTLTLIHHHSNPLILFHHSHSFPISLLTLHSHTSNRYLPFIFHRSHSFHPSIFLFLYLPSYTSHSYRFFASHLRFLLWDLIHVCSDSRYHMFICSVDRKHTQSIRRTCFCLWCMIREHQHRMMRKWENAYLMIGGNRCSRSTNHRSRFHQTIIEWYLHQSNTKSILSRITDPIFLKLKLPP